ncbi:hypothetical protein SEPCBS119000_001203 [Sporothrix epigloea]|uniref:Uncharacterized protein n=1 Tax=Sporothrix epigloea TaxID=1892477 RepID=A0ABP0D9E9_9PEZI
MNVMPTPSAYAHSDGRIGNKSNGSLVRHGKRKAIDSPGGNERLSKRLSLLNLGLSTNVSGGCSKSRVLIEPEEPDTTTYATVEIPPAVASVPAAVPTLAPERDSATESAPALRTPLKDDLHAKDAGVSESLPKVQPVAAPQPPVVSARLHNATDEDMLVDDTKYKVYIHNIDDELSDDRESVSSDMDANAETSSAGDSSTRLVFLPDIDKCLRSAARTAALTGHTSNPPAHKKLFVPRPILPNDQGELAGMQLVLYNDPSSLSVPRESDSVRQAILDARARIRERQRETKSETPALQASVQDLDVDASMAGTPPPADGYSDFDAMDID